MQQVTDLCCGEAGWERPGRAFFNILLTGLDGTTATVDLMSARDEDIECALRSFKAMSHPLRLKILCTLGDREVSVQNIAGHVGTSQSNISRHLAMLRDEGILMSRKDANGVFYRVGDAGTLRLIGMMREVFCSQAR